MQIELKSGNTKTLRVGNWKATNVREFRVLDSLHLVGLTGQIASVNLILSDVPLFDPIVDFALERNHITSWSLTSTASIIIHGIR